MNASNFALLLHPSLRGRAFIQNMVKEQLLPSEIILMNESKEDFGDEIRLDKYDFFNPNIKVKDTLEKHNLNFTTVDSVDCNNSLVVDAVSELKSEWLIFSGGGILRNQFLSLGKKIVHIHPGKLPDYRGSTCFYYSMLNNQGCTCTAFLMEKGLDSGKVLYYEHFNPPKNIDLDNIYDNWMRAVTLIKVINKIKKGNITLKDNDEAKSNMYYIIHPVLKHISILKNNNEI
tara:strand:- start:67 stop:759 length:693 start_codon:yes stop_codon:yes gene_type:complete